MRVAISQEMDQRTTVALTAMVSGGSSEEAIYSNQPLPRQQQALMAIEMISSQQPMIAAHHEEEEEVTIEELPPPPPDSSFEAGGAVGIEQQPQLQHNMVSSVDYVDAAAPHILEEMRRRALNSDFESGV